jgi:hypothetical protein
LPSIHEALGLITATHTHTHTAFRTVDSLLTPRIHYYIDHNSTHDDILLIFLAGYFSLNVFQKKKKCWKLSHSAIVLEGEA